MSAARQSDQGAFETPLGSMPGQYYSDDQEEYGVKQSSNGANSRHTSMHECGSAVLSVLTFVMLCIITLALDRVDMTVDAGMRTAHAKIDAGLDKIKPPSLTKLVEDLGSHTVATGKRHAESISDIAKKAAAVDWTTEACFPTCTQPVLKQTRTSSAGQGSGRRSGQGENKVGTPSWDWKMLRSCSHWAANRTCKGHLCGADELSHFPKNLQGKGFGISSKDSKDMSKYLKTLSAHIDRTLHDDLKAHNSTDRDHRRRRLFGNRNDVSSVSGAAADPVGAVCAVAKAYKDMHPFAHVFRSTLLVSLGFQVTWPDKVTWMVDDTIDALFDALYKKARAGGVC